MTKSIKDCAKRNDIRSMKVLAKEIVNSRKVVSRLYHNKAQMNSVSMMLTEQLATVIELQRVELNRLLSEQKRLNDRIDTLLVPPIFGDSSGVRGAAWLWDDA